MDGWRERNGGGGRGWNERDRDERKVLGSRKHKQNVNQPSTELIERGETELCRGRKRGRNQREESEVHRGASE